jgi:molybdopterin molybdotransferase
VTTVERVHVRAALGRVLAADVISPLDVPRTTTRRWTATRCASPTSGRRRSDAQVAGTALPASRSPGRVTAGEGVRIMTGGVVPAGADTIVMQEHVKAAGKVTIGGGHRKGQNLRRKAGEDCARRAPALRSAGSRCAPPRSA